MCRNAKSVLASSTCTCLPGYTGKGGRSPCTACGAGTYSDQGGSQAPCQDCETGKYSNTTAANESSYCLACPGPGSSTSSSGAVAVEDCFCRFPGYMSNCTACPRGKFKQGNGPEHCSRCPPGKYSSASGSSTCHGCLANSNSTIGSSICICKAGYSGPDGGNCSACVPGKFKGSQGSQACSLCPRGKYVEAVSASRCISCAHSTYSPEGSAFAVNCTTPLPTTGTATPPPMVIGWGRLEVVHCALPSTLTWFDIRIHSRQGTVATGGLGRCD